MISVVRYDRNPISFIGECAGECWGADTTDPVKNYIRGKDCLESWHGRTFEFPDIVVKISGYSARVIREIYTHIIGTTRLQESTRYVNCEDFPYFIPPSILSDVRRLAVYDRTMNYIKQGYKELIALETPKEDAANVLPLGMDSKIVLKINLRAILSMGEQRLCTRAYHEYRKFMNELKELLRTLDDEWKEISNDYILCKCIRHGYCAEKKSCGIRPKKLKDGTLLYTEKNAKLCPMYRDSHIDGCSYSPAFEKAWKDGKSCVFCTKCLKLRVDLGL